MKIATFPGIVFLSLLSFRFLSSAYGATLSSDEVEALKDIAKTLGKTNWDFNVDPCSRQGNWTTKSDENSVTCDCSDAGGTVCHVTSIILKKQDLPGKLPPELIRLPYLQEFDVTRNYLNGTIPKDWGSMKLVNISLLGNRLTGPIPIELANISTLKSLVLEYNQFSGNLPPELGELPNLQRLLITSNNFVGELPSTFANLITLNDIRIGDNQFSGVIPDFIQNWTNLIRLIIHGTNLSGPIPSAISVLQSLTDLRISELKGSGSTFPPLRSLTGLKTLVLRNCNISGTLPGYLGTMSSLKVMDLSFNKLIGDIPNTFSDLRKVKIYLSGNLLTGQVPDWTAKEDNLDLSYNNFSIGNSVKGCQKENVNLFASSSNSETAVSCLKSRGCSKTHYFLRINCGGGQVIVNGSKTFDDDSDSTGSAGFHEGASDWGFSSTGNFLDNDVGDYYTCSNSSRLSMINAELYTRARVSPISLTYYAFCMQNGNYTVNLHFAEIMFTNDNTYNSLGRRIFDIYIQGKRVLQDFNIAKEAGGAGKAVIKPFIAVVTNNTLEIHLFWTGKGTTAIPFKSVYGPLISAISVDPNFKPPSENTISTGAVVGIVAAIAIVVILVFCILWWKGCLGKKSSLANELKGIESQTGLFSLRQIKTATNNFDIANKIGEGGFGPVYKGLLSDGTIIAVKQLSTKSRQGNREFVNEIGMISALQHPHLVKLYGCCVEGDQLLLIYEYMENNSLARALFGPEESQLKLDWPTRQKICIGIARGLAYLHEESRLKIIHRDIKATNVLLDKDLNPKISDFGMAKLYEEDDTHISTRIAGTYGYMAPEYAMHGYLTDKADVYSFGIVTLEIVSGRSNTIHRGKEEAYYVLEWANLLKQKGTLMELVDKRLGSNFNQEEVMVMINVALLCTNVTAASRPNMSSVVSMLEGRSVVHELVSNTSEALDEKKLEAMRQYYRQMEIDQSQSISMDGPWTASSASAKDLYPVHLDSSYLEKRNN